jgi:hypothetical protein
MKFFAQAFLIAAFLFLGSCRTAGVVLQETPLNISETRVAVVTVTGQPRQVSENGREIFSKYYDKKNNNLEKDKMDMARERYYTHVVILGDRRPYDIQVEVLIEARTPEGGWELVNHDDGRAGAIAEKIKNALAQSRDKRNVIDDFRSF